MKFSASDFNMDQKSLDVNTEQSFAPLPPEPKGAFMKFSASDFNMDQKSLDVNTEQSFAPLPPEPKGYLQMYRYSPFVVCAAKGGESRPLYGAPLHLDASAAAPPGARPTPSPTVWRNNRMRPIWSLISAFGVIGTASAGGGGSGQGRAMVDGGIAAAGSNLDQAAPVIGGGNGKKAESAAPETNVDDGVAAMMGRLKLTSREAKTFVLAAADEEAIGGPEWALVGKVLAPNTLHVNTISAIVKPAWGNPRGLMVIPCGKNLFLAEFETKVDMQRVLNGSPWVVSKNAILLKAFNPRVRPAETVFDRLLLWVRIYGLPFSLMNSERGGALAGMIDNVEKVEVDEKGRAWGEYLRVRIDVDITEPFMRWVAVDSPSMSAPLFYEVKYEKLPMYCFSCGLLGHSSLLCPTPASRDENGMLPWNSERLCVPEVKWRDQRSSSGQGAQSSQGSSSQPSGKERKDAEVSSPVKTRKVRARKPPQTAKGQTAAAEGGKATGTKRKQVYVPKKPGTLAITDQPAVDGVVEVVLPGDNVGVSEETQSDDSNKKQRKNPNSRSADQAAAVDQPRLTQ
ncbi:hypothetical protein QYE76_029129 [Lolium multiflorum]|uniref:CCHC-type domain-containing protein n=1 Tax=Lolium multiflorum TaxID=4521 RepID=A0AAD8QNL2_LOLMU|nr:hypothetical protein QYE76_029129 [Lolium multiflorum]